MSPDWYHLIQFVIFLPLYLTAFIGIGRVLRLRRTHPRACWLAVASGALLFMNWAATAAMNWEGESLFGWLQTQGLPFDLVWIAFNVTLSALQTTAAVLLVGAILSGRRQNP